MFWAALCDKVLIVAISDIWHTQYVIGGEVVKVNNAVGSVFEFGCL